MAIIALCSIIGLPATAGEYVFCLGVNRVAIEAGLQQFSDRQIRNGLCITTKEIVSAIVANNDIKVSICSNSAAYMMLEFRKRFPTEDPKTVAGMC